MLADVSASAWTSDPQPFPETYYQRMGQARRANWARSDLGKKREGGAGHQNYHVRGWAVRKPSK